VGFDLGHRPHRRYLRRRPELGEGERQRRGGARRSGEGYGRGCEVGPLLAVAVAAGLSSATAFKIGHGEATASAFAERLPGTLEPRVGGRAEILARVNRSLSGFASGELSAVPGVPRSFGWRALAGLKAEW